MNTDIQQKGAPSLLSAIREEAHAVSKSRGLDRPMLAENGKVNAIDPLKVAPNTNIQPPQPVPRQYQPLNQGDIYSQIASQMSPTSIPKRHTVNASGMGSAGNVGNDTNLYRQTPPNNDMPAMPYNPQQPYNPNTNQPYISQQPYMPQPPYMPLQPPYVPPYQSVPTNTTPQTSSFRKHTNYDFEKAFYDRLMDAVESVKDTKEYYNAIHALFALYATNNLSEKVMDSLSKEDKKEIRGILRDFVGLISMY